VWWGGGEGCCVCMCVCAGEREKERERVCVFAYVRACECKLFTFICTVYKCKSTHDYAQCCLPTPRHKNKCHKRCNSTHQRVTALQTHTRTHKHKHMLTLTHIHVYAHAHRHKTQHKTHPDTCTMNNPIKHMHTSKTLTIICRDTQTRIIIGYGGIDHGRADFWKNWSIRKKTNRFRHH